MSRDVVFDKNKSRNWSNQADDIDNQAGMFKIMFNKSTKENEEVGEEENNDEGENTEEPLIAPPVDNEQKQPLRRSIRISKTPSYLEDYINLADFEGERLLMISVKTHGILMRQSKTRYGEMHVRRRLLRF